MSDDALILEMQRQRLMYESLYPGPRVWYGAEEAPIVKLKVKKAVLVAAIGKKQKELKDAYDKQVAEWEKENAAKEKRVLKGVEDYVAQVKAGKVQMRHVSLNTFLSREHGIGDFGYWAYKPTQPPDYAHLLSRLELSTDDELTLDDRSDYFAFLDRR